MKELLRTNDMVLISYLESELGAARIGHVVFDTNMSVLEGSIGALPRRIMVEDVSFARARALLDRLGIDHGC